MSEPQHTELLPEPLPREPLEVVNRWLTQAIDRRAQPNPDAMVLASVNAVGQPSARVVLCKGIIANPGYVRFVSNYDSRKGRELALNPRAALVMHWDHAHRQARMEGHVVQGTASQSDAYFASRHRDSQLGAWASAQSQPLNSREALTAAVASQAERFAGQQHIPRPPYWGMYQLWVEAVELWSEGDARIHDRARWQRELQAANLDGDEGGAAGGEQPAAFTAGPWTATRLQP